MENLIGLKIKALKSFKHLIPERKQFFKKHPELLKQRFKLELEYILFDDGETIMSFSEQDYYDFHDCDKTARCVKITKDKEQWNRINENEDAVDFKFLENSF